MIPHIANFNFKKSDPATYPNVSLERAPYGDSSVSRVFVG